MEILEYNWKFQLILNLNHSKLNVDTCSMSSKVITQIFSLFIWNKETCHKLFRFYKTLSASTATIKRQLRSVTVLRVRIVRIVEIWYGELVREPPTILTALF